MHNGDGKALPSCLYPIYYLNESLPCDFLSDNGILLISTSLILIGFLLLWKVLFNDAIFSEMYGFLLHFYIMKRKKANNIFYFNILASRFFFWYSFSLFYYDICFFHIFAFHFFLLQISFCIYLLLAFLIFLYHFHNNL